MASFVKLSCFACETEKTINCVLELIQVISSSNIGTLSTSSITKNMGNTTFSFIYQPKVKTIFQKVVYHPLFFHDPCSLFLQEPCCPLQQLGMFTLLI